MKTRSLVVLAFSALAAPAAAQATRVTISGGDVALTDASRLAARIPGIDAELRARVRVSGDSAQRIALDDFDWKGRVTSVEIDEEDARTYWDVKIIPDSTHQTIVRYRVDALSGGIMSIKEFTGVRGLAKRKPR
jgi:uncharacterized membrane protein YkoI